MKNHLTKLRIEVLWSYTRNGSFQRARIYKKKNISKTEKVEFRNCIKGYLRDQIYNEYKDSQISEEEIIKLIDNLIELVNSKFNHILSSNKLKFGNAQKIVNLFVKSMWISGWLKKSPPHFPIDRIIQKKIGTKENWTNMDKETYLKIIAKAKEKIDKNMSLGEWEALAYLEIQKSVI